MVNNASANTNLAVDLDSTLKGVLNAIEREREREIISRRFGLQERKETLEQIGELLSITRERVRQLEKATILRLKAAAGNGQLNEIKNFEKQVVGILSKNHNILRVAELAALMTKEGNRADQAKIFFLSKLAPGLAVIDESDDFYSAIGVSSIHDEAQINKLVTEIINTIKKIGHPANIEEIAKDAGNKDANQIAALAKTSKLLAELNGQWGLMKWPMVNPKNIRDKIYVILHEKGSHMHFGDIASAIRKSDFKRKDVTTQAIHNELIKDTRFVLIGRGIYALEEWGYKQGTVADVIAEVLREANEPLHRDEIVKLVLKTRHVKETTVLLNLQGKNRFKRVAKATYTLA
jgi:predicted metalloprotease